MSENMYEKGATKTLKSLSVKCNYSLYKLTCVRNKNYKIILFNPNHIDIF